MAVFSKLSVWPTGYFRAYSSWLLCHRRDVVRRIAVLNAEIERIGLVKVYYAAVPGENGTLRTEQRTGIYVTPHSNVGRLMQAYIAMGGDPLSISPFMYPERATSSMDLADSATPQEQEYPQNGVVAPMSGVPNEPIATDQDPGFQGYQGGYLKTAAYYPARQGGRTDPGAYDHDAVVKSMHQMRAWANQDIKERLQNLGWRIIKQCDLREQLVNERDEVLVQAFGGALEGVGPFDSNYFDERFQVQNIVQDMYRMLYGVDSIGRADFKANLQSVALQFTFPDDPSEIGRDMLGC